MLLTEQYWYLTPINVREAVALGRARAKASAQSRMTNSRNKVQDKA